LLQNSPLSLIPFKDNQNYIGEKALDPEKAIKLVKTMLQKGAQGKVRNSAKSPNSKSKKL
jgi:hypothetical protein